MQAGAWMTSAPGGPGLDQPNIVKLRDVVFETPPGERGPGAALPFRQKATAVAARLVCKSLRNGSQRASMTV
jgi:hypothetical protein